MKGKGHNARKPAAIKNPTTSGQAGNGNIFAKATMLHPRRREAEGADEGVCVVRVVRLYAGLPDSAFIAPRSSFPPSAARAASVRRWPEGFLQRVSKKAPTRREFAAYGQASIAMAKRLFFLPEKHDARLFAAAISCEVEPRPGPLGEEVLRKDHVFLLERYYYFLEGVNEHGLIVMDETDEREDRKFVRRLERYFTKTLPGIERTYRIVPVPFFVSSDMAYPVQVADVCIYCVNWGYRLPSQGMNAPVRDEIAKEFGPLLDRIQYRGDAYKDGQVFKTWGILYVPNPYGWGKW